MTTTIEAVDLFYLSMPEVLDIGDGSQDMCLVRVRAGGHTGWGECEAAPLPTIAALICPLSHSACHPVIDSVVGARLDDPSDIAAIGVSVRANSLDLLQADHTWSGIEIALWDLLGRRFEEPVHHLLGARNNHPKRPYASVLFGDTPEETFAKARDLAGEGWTAAKFGWGPFGRGSVQADADLVVAAREGLGTDADLLIDAGTVFGADVEAATARLPALEAAAVTWLEEPFVTGALDSYGRLATRATIVRLAGGEGAHQPHQARLLIDHGAVGFIQVDTGRIGGIQDAREVALHAASRGVRYVNHTFTSHLALSASIQPYVDLGDHELCEYPAEPKALATDCTRTHLVPGSDGLVRAPEAPGLGLEVDVEALRPYLVDVDITVGGRVLYRTPALEA
ncbi:mandelate racemase/muconate lactonizing enzyme family protein [Aestuariimicrobium kwangyangense]|uniref:mandelate racemase/muconate lactonizing enzyme family protein n=1 Tax=Aestuariimicrobium kwangyangense TaxID=396389 RepID=UPI0003B559A4|nr:mandelate racemase/muconate lactonizing enzyme family protein [Aestuariimicrobium kwangyangense]